MNKPTTSTGFTLIEVMVALAIIAIALASLIKASGSHTQSASYLKNKTLAHYVAMNEIAQIQIDKSWPNIGEQKKSTEMAGHEWFWTRSVEKLNDDNDYIRSLKFKVYLGEDRKRSLAQVETYIANPANNQAINQNGNQATN